MKAQLTAEQIVRKNKRMFFDYNRFKDLQGRYNTGKIEGEVFTLIRIKDGQKITSFNIKTFLPE